MKLLVSVGSGNSVKIKAVESAFALFYQVEVKGVEVSSGVSRQPIGEETIKGAVIRAKNSLKAVPNADCGVGIEAGLFTQKYTVIGYMDIQWCVIIDREGRITIGCGPGFEHPPPVIKEVVNRNIEINEAMEAFTGIKEIGKKMGAVGFLTKGVLNRERITEHCVIMALIPRINDYKHSSLVEDEGQGLIQ